MFMKGKDTTMKLRFLSIIPILLISGCVAQIGAEPNGEKYTNVSYEFVRNDNYYKVEYSDYNDEKSHKEWKVSPSNVYYVFYSSYVYDEENHIIYNEFYVKGINYSLFVYKKQWFIGVLLSIIFVLIIDAGTSFFIG